MEQLGKVEELHGEVMDQLHDAGVSAIQNLQSNFKAHKNIFLMISNLGDPRYAFLIYAPLIYSLNWKVGRRLMWVTIIAEWSNQVMKWMLQGERPYWWIHETGMYNETDETPRIRQYHLTCETGPGSPSGHAMVSAAVWYIILDFLLHETGATKQLGHIVVSSLKWFLYSTLLIVVSLSRIYIAAHFPHQCLMGIVIGWAVAKLTTKLDTDHMTRKQYIIASVALLASALATFFVLLLMGINPLWSIERAIKWCYKEEHVHVDTTPFFSMMRYVGFPLGMGLGVGSRFYKRLAKAKFTYGMRLMAALLAVSAGKLSENIPLPKDNIPLLYLSALIFNTGLAYFMFAVAPYIVVTCFRLSKYKVQ